MAFQGIAPVGFVGKSHVTDALGANHPEVGTRANFDGEDYLWVYNDGNSDLPPSFGATTLLNSGMSVTLSSITGTDLFIGVCKHVTLTTAAYGWLLTRGFVDVELGANDSGITGQPVGPGVNGVFAARTAATTVVVAGQVSGKLLESVASAASGKIYLNV